MEHQFDKKENSRVRGGEKKKRRRGEREELRKEEEKKDMGKMREFYPCKMCKIKRKGSISLLLNWPLRESLFMCLSTA